MTSKAEKDFLDRHPKLIGTHGEYVTDKWGVPYRFPWGECAMVDWRSDKVPEIRGEFKDHRLNHWQSKEAAYAAEQSDWNAYRMPQSLRWLTYGWNHSAYKQVAVKEYLREQGLEHLIVFSDKTLLHSHPTEKAFTKLKKASTKDRSLIKEQHFYDDLGLNWCYEAELNIWPNPMYRQIVPDGELADAESNAHMD